MLLPDVHHSLLVRTDFSDDAAWLAVCRATEGPDADDVDEPFLGYIDDRDFESATVAAVSAAMPSAGETGCVYVADAWTMTQPDNPVLAIDLRDEPGRSFRIVPSEMRGFDVNMLISNMDFADFADATGFDGVFRGFPGNDGPVGSGAGPDEAFPDAPVADGQGELPAGPARADQARADSDFTVLPVPDVGRPGFYWQWLDNDHDAPPMATPVALVLERLAGGETVGWRMWAACADGTVRGLSPSRPGSGTLVPWPVDGVG